MSVVSKSEAGARGYMVTEARYGKATMDRWRRKGGRPRNKTLAEIRAEEKRERRATKGTTGPSATE